MLTAFTLALAPARRPPRARGAGQERGADAGGVRGAGRRSAGCGLGPALAWAGLDDATARPGRRPARAAGGAADGAGWLAAVPAGRAGGAAAVRRRGGRGGRGAALSRSGARARASSGWPRSARNGLEGLVRALLYNLVALPCALVLLADRRRPGAGVRAGQRRAARARAERHGRAAPSPGWQCAGAVLDRASCWAAWSWRC